VLWFFPMQIALGFHTVPDTVVSALMPRCIIFPRGSLLPAFTLRSNVTKIEVSIFTTPFLCFQSFLLEINRNVKTVSRRVT